MRTLSAVFAGAVLVCGVAGTASAQRGGRMGQMGGRTASRAGGQQLGKQAERQLAQRQLFRGITLTDAQKTQLQTLRADGRTQTQALMKTARANRQAMRTARENGDTVALNTARHEARGDANRRIALRGQLITQVRGVLTPDQQKQFDTNRARLRHRATRAMRGRRGGAQRRGMMPAGPRGRGGMPMRGGGGGGGGV